LERTLGQQKMKTVYRRSCRFECRNLCKRTTVWFYVGCGISLLSYNYIVWVVVQYVIICGRGPKNLFWSS